VAANPDLAEDLREALALVRDELANLDAKIASTRAKAVTLDGEDLARRWLSEDLTARRTVLADLVSRVDVGIGRQGRDSFDNHVDRVRVRYRAEEKD
jgi:hypothetical protein